MIIGWLVRWRTPRGVVHGSIRYGTRDEARKAGLRHDRPHARYHDVVPIEVIGEGDE